MSTWFPITDRHPRSNALVVLKWDWREVEVVRIGQHWIRQDAHGRPEQLPPKAERDQWSDTPTAWRPARLEHWPDPLPEPVRLSEPGRFVDIRPRRLAAMTRQAEEAERIKAEIEAEIGADDADGAGDDRRKPGWWRSPGAVVYAAPGGVERHDAEGRILRAILTDGRRVVARPRAFEHTAAALASLVAEHVSAEDERWEPSHRDLTDYGEAMRWFAAIAPLEERPARAPVDWLSGRQKALIYVALGRSWRRIASLEGGSHEGWRRTYAGALERVWRAANGRPVADHFTPADQIAALRERNQAYKRG